MNKILIIGVVLFVGFVLGQEFRKKKLPKIIGYLIAGILLNPNLAAFVPRDIITHTNIIENIAIAFIAFSIGGSIVFSELKKLGKSILCITIFEAQVTFLFITLGLLAVLPFIAHDPGATWITTFIPLALLLGCLGSPTDPSVALAITHQYKTKGDVSLTMLNVAGFDDILGIINFSVAVVIAKVLISKEAFSISHTVLAPIFIIGGSVVLGIVMGFILNVISERIESQTEGVLFVLILSFITISWGIATLLGVEEILAIMVMGIVVANFNYSRKKIFKMLERYSEELIMLIFFTLSAMHLNFGVLKTVSFLLLFFIIFRIIGKFVGTFIGAGISGSSVNVKKYTATGLIPFGGIVIGLALILQQNPIFENLGNILVSTVIGAAVINEFIAPFFVKRALKASGEILREK